MGLPAAALPPQALTCRKKIVYHNNARKDSTFPSHRDSRPLYYNLVRLGGPFVPLVGSQQLETVTHNFAYQLPREQ